jgi:hypothetical protein
MTALLRRSLLLMLMLSLPFSGVAGPLLGMFDPCPMQSHEHHQMALQDQAGEHCGHQAKPQAKVVKLCKSGHECQSSSMLVVLFGKPMTLAVSIPQRAHRSFESLSSGTADVWRPPQV